MAKKKRYEKTGNFFSVSSDIQNALAAVQAEKERIADVERTTCADLIDWVPGHVSKATADIYAIKKSEVAQIKATRGEDGNFSRGRNTGKGNVRVSTNGAETVAGLTFTFRGAKHASWTTRAGKQAKVPKTRKKIKKNGRKYSIPKPYETNVETYKGQRTPIRPRGQNRVFVMSGKDGKLRAMHIRPGDKQPMPHGSSSLPQAIANDKVTAIWRPQMQAYIIKRITNHDKQSAKGAAYLKRGGRRGRA